MQKEQEPRNECVPMNDSRGKSTPAKIKIRNVVHTLKTPDLCLPISGVSVTTTLPDGTEDETVFCEVFTGEEVATSIANNLELSDFPHLKIQRVPRKTVTYHIREPERS